MTNNICCLEIDINSNNSNITVTGYPHTINSYIKLIVELIKVHLYFEIK